MNLFRCLLLSSCVFVRAVATRVSLPVWSCCRLVRLFLSTRCHVYVPFSRRVLLSVRQSDCARLGVYLPPAVSLCLSLSLLLCERLFECLVLLLCPELFVFHLPYILLSCRVCFSLTSLSLVRLPGDQRGRRWERVGLRCDGADRCRARPPHASP